MEIIRASVLGFCFGVRRAVELAEKALKDYQEKNVYSLGPLIHNETALESLGSKGLKIIDEKDVVTIPENSVVIIRAHGVAPSIINEIENKNCTIIDATCPRVKASQKMVEKYTSDKDFVILTGDKNHGEVIGIAGYAGKNFLLIQNKEEAENLNGELFDNLNVVLLSQTTFSPGDFYQIEKILKSKINNITVMNTICPATNERQEALSELCDKVQGVLVIGGKNSANTTRLFQSAKSKCNICAHIQGAENIPEDFFNLKSVGITAGASTPDSIIDSVEDALKNKQ